MSRTVTLAVALLTALPLAARAQTRNLQGRASREPAGIAVPGLSVAGAEEPTALEVNPAGTALVDAFTLQYFHQGREGSGEADDGFWLTTPIGPFVPTLSMQWIRPGDVGGSRFRKTSLGLGLGGRSGGLAVAWNWYDSPDRALGDLSSFDAGLTVRPWRHLSIGAAVLGMNARLAGRRLPIHYDLGAATRLWNDGLTLSADLLSDDQGRGDLRATAAAFAAGVELGVGLALQLQLQVPAHAGLTGPTGATYGELAITWNGPHSGVTVAAGTGTDADHTWLLGARFSAQRYRAPVEHGATVPSLDLVQALARSRSPLGGERDPYGKLLERLAAIRDEGEVPGLAVRIDGLSLGQGRVEELRQLLLQIKARKPVVAYLVGGGMKEYYLASAATVVLAPPSSSLFPAGLASTTPFVKGGLDKLGVTFDVVAVGKYKNAPDPLVRQDMSEAQREVTNSLLDDLYARQVRGIAAARGLPEARVRELVEVGIFNAEQAREAKLIDATAWPDELEAVLARHLGRRHLHLATSWEPGEERAAQRWGPRPAVAVVRVEGAIAQGKSRRDPFGAASVAGSETVAKLLRQATDDHSVRAIVLRVDSPGGDGLASDLIWREVMQARRAGKPVIVSMGDLAASGGYLVAVAADAIVAEPSTLTGSIGVFAVKPDLSGLMAKLGIGQTTLKRGEHADLQTFTRRWTEAERALVEQQVLAFYDLFLRRVADGRRLPKERVDELARGRVWTGAQALERGLVDRLGTFEDAVRLAEERAGFPPGERLELKRFEPPRSFWADLTGGFVAEEGTLLAALGRVPELRAAALLLELGPLVALPPGWIGDPELPGSTGGAD